MIMSYHEVKHAELARISALVEAYERLHEARHRESGEPVQRAFLYASDPRETGDSRRYKFVFGNGMQVIGIDDALSLIRAIADAYGIDWRTP
jgi:hypothetical protein